MNGLAPDLWVSNSNCPWIPGYLNSNLLILFVFYYFSLLQVKIIAVNFRIFILIEIKVLAREDAVTLYPTTYRIFRTDFNKALQYCVHLNLLPNSGVWLINVLLIGLHFAFTDFEDVTKVTDQVVKGMAEVNLYVTCVKLDANLAVDCLCLFSILFYFQDAVYIEFFYDGKLLF